jgi:hypothetical protein
MLKVRFLALLAMLALLLILPAVASAQQVPPHIVMGTATVNGLLAPAGTPITAMIGEEQVGSDTVRTNGEFGPMQVRAGDGTEIVFRVGTLTADQTATWEQGGAAVLSLTASSFGAPGPGGTPLPPGSLGPAGPAGPSGSSGFMGILGLIGFILAIIALIVAAAVFFMGRGQHPA